MKALALLVLCAAALLRAQDYSLGPDSQPKDGIQKGTVTRLKLEPGKLLRSLNNSVRVLVVASSDLPPVWGHLRRPGTLPAVSDTAQKGRLTFS
jgi:hypothetical protein